MPDSSPAFSTAAPATQVTTAQACQRHLAHILDLAAAIQNIPQQAEALPALTDVLPRLIQAQLSGEMLAQQLVRSGPPLVQAPSLMSEPDPEEEPFTPLQSQSAHLARQLVSWAAEHHWDSRYLTPADTATLDPVETIVRDVCHDLAALSATIQLIEDKWRRYEDDSRRNPAWVDDVAFFHVHSPWRRQLPRLWGAIRAIHTTVDAER